MKKLLLFAAVIGICSTSCKKSTTTTPTPSAPSGPSTPTIPTDGWTLDGTKYTQNWGTQTGGNAGNKSVSAGDGPIGSGNSFNFFFNTIPTVNGTYKVVFFAGGQVLAADEVGVTAGLETAQKTYVSIGNDNVSATVTVNSGKIKIELPDTKVFNTKTAGDTVILTGTLVETF